MLELTDSAVRKRWYRLITRLTDHIADIARGDRDLRTTFALILQDEGLFRSALFGLLSLRRTDARRAAAGLSVVERAIQTFGSRDGAVRWLHDICPALRARPIDLVGTERGRREVENVLACIDHGMAY